MLSCGNKSFVFNTMFVQFTTSLVESSLFGTLVKIKTVSDQNHLGFTYQFVDHKRKYCNCISLIRGSLHPQYFYCTNNSVEYHFICFVCIISELLSCIGSVMVRLSVLDRGFTTRSSQTKDFKLLFTAFSTKTASLRSKSQSCSSTKWTSKSSHINLICSRHDIGKNNCPHGFKQ